jgi:hypothetical protein
MTLAETVNGIIGAGIFVVIGLLAGVAGTATCLALLVFVVFV